MWLSQHKLLWIFSPRYLNESVWFNTWPWMVYSLWIGDFLFVAMRTSHLSGLNLINQLFYHCYKLSKSLCRMAWSSVFLILLCRRESSVNSRVVDETTDGKSLMKSRNKRGPKTVIWETPEETVVAVHDWPSSTTHCMRPAECWLSNHGGGLWPHSVVVSSEVYCAAPYRRPTSKPLARSSMESIS